MATTVDTQVEAPVAPAAPKAVKKIRIPKAHSVSLAAKIRFLDSKGMARADIARTLDIRYQRVRNVLVPRNAQPADESTDTVELNDEPEQPAS